MARFIISNKENVVREFDKICQIAGFKVNSIVYKKGYSLATYKKLKINNENYFEANNCFIGIAGTLIYKGKLGLSALTLILNDFKQYNFDIDILRQNCIGNYICAIKIENNIYIFCDPNNIFYAYYFYDGQNWAISNCLYELEKSLDECNPKINWYVLFEEMYSRCIWGDETVFNNIFRLAGDCYLNIDLLNHSLVKTKLRKHIQIKYCSFDNIANDFIKSYTLINNTIKNVFNNKISLAVTGGLDSRFLLSGLLHVGCKPKLLYGISNSRLIPTKAEDKQIVQTMSNRLGLPLQYLNWNVKEPIDSNWEDLIDKYGFLARVYSGIKPFHDSIEQDDSDLICWGYFGEAYTYDNNLKSNFDIDHYCDSYIGKRAKTLLNSNFDVYSSGIKAKIMSSAEELGLNPTNNTVDFWIKLELLKRCKSDSALINLCNQHRYSIALLGEPKLMDFAYIPATYKKNRRFLLHIMNIIFPSLLNIPIFSHEEIRKIDPSKLELSYSFRHHVVEKLNFAISNNKMRSGLVNIYRKMNSKGNQDCRTDERIINRLHE